MAEPILEVSELHKSYDEGRIEALRGVDLAIHAGEFLAISGPSGSGKSSLVEDILFASLAKTLHRAKTFPGAHDAIRGVDIEVEI